VRAGKVRSCLNCACLYVCAFSAIGILGLAACSYSASQTTSGNAVHFPSARTSKEGDSWIAWDKSQRLSFIDGYIQGNRDGHQNGCGTAEQLIASNAETSNAVNGLLMHCLASKPSFTMSLDHYEGGITTFYQEYPPDREIPIRLVLQFMSDDSRKTPEQMHTWFVSQGRAHSPEK
jgi:hypothetical protein